MAANLDVQGYCLNAEQSVGAVAGWTRRHPFDLTCGLVTMTNFCVPSTLLGIWWQRRGITQPTTQPG